MADLTITITNSMNMLGVSEGNRWGEFLWSEVWGVSEDVWTDTDKGVANPLTVEDRVYKSVELSMLNSIALSSDIVSVRRSIGLWDYMWTKPTSEALDQVYDVFSPASNQDSTWADVPDASDTWTEV
jgi:hypothetical protein